VVWRIYSTCLSAMGLLVISNGTSGGATFHEGSSGHHQPDGKRVRGERFYDGEALGAIVHFNDRNSIRIQETFNKIVTPPWYTTSSIGYTRSR